MAPLTILYVVYAVGVSAWIISENRRPQSTFAWLFLLVTLPVAGVVVYVLFGRMRGGFGRTRKLVRQRLPREMGEVRSRAWAEHEAALAEMDRGPPLLAHLARLAHAACGSLVTTSNRVEVLPGAREKYPKLLEDLEAARESIHLQYYIWRPDDLGDRLLELLARKVREGVEVRLLYDPVGSFGVKSALYWRRVRSAGIACWPSSPLWRLHTISYRNHRKIAVIDGRIGYCGGINIGEEHEDPRRLYGPEASDVWRDTHLRVTGVAVRALQRVFLVDWANATGDKTLEPRHFPDVEDDAPTDGVPLQFVLSGPDSEWRAIRQQYLGMISGARERLRVRTPYFVLEGSLIEALKMAAMSGVDVSIMVTGNGPDQRLVYWAARTYIAEIATAGVEVLMFEGGMLHAKTVAVDGRVASVGSGNWDIRSFSINYELNAMIYDEAIAAQVEDEFERDRALCRRFDPEEYRAMPRHLRFRDSLARLVSPLL